MIWLAEWRHEPLSDRCKILKPILDWDCQKDTKNQGYEPTSVYSVIASVILAKLSMILALFENFWLEIQNIQKSSFHEISDYFNTFKRSHSVVICELSLPQCGKTCLKSHIQF